MGPDDGEVVQLYVYDLSNGLARQLSPMLLKKQVSKSVYASAPFCEIAGLQHVLLLSD